MSCFQFLYPFNNYQFQILYQRIVNRVSKKIHVNGKIFSNMIAPAHPAYIINLVYKGKHFHSLLHCGRNASGTFLQYIRHNNTSSMMLHCRKFSSRFLRCFFLICLGLLAAGIPGSQGQSVLPADSPVQREQASLIRLLRSRSADTAGGHSLLRVIEKETLALYRRINKEKKPVLEKEKAIRSLAYFIHELEEDIAREKILPDAIPGAYAAYLSLLNAVLNHQPLLPLLQPLSPELSQVLASAFSQYKEVTVMDDVAVYKRVAASPQFILRFLESQPRFRFADSLLLYAAFVNPPAIRYYMGQVSNPLQTRIRNSSNRYLRQMVAIATDKQATELLPFVVQLANNVYSPQQVKEKRADPLAYFQLLVNTLQESDLSDPSSLYLKPLRKGIREKALDFYVREINNLHASPDAVRFASVKALRPQDLYYVITQGAEDLYTSSYLGLYKRLMQFYSTTTADSVLELVRYDQFRVFLRLAANYNMLGDFLGRLSPETTALVLHRFITGIEQEDATALEKAMDIADSFTALSAAPGIASYYEKELRENLSRCRSRSQYLGIRLYSILTDIFGMLQQENGIRHLWSRLGDYGRLSRKALENKEGSIVQLVLFYGDEDGVSSFGHFLRHYTDNKKWEIQKNANWVSIRSLGASPLLIYANRPLDMQEERDLRAQDSLIQYLKSQSREPAVLVHRGHSYHLDKTLERITPAVKLAILGSCGGYNKAISLARISPDIQLIGSKQTGAMSVNDPIIEAINETLLQEQDLDWSQLWKELGKRFMQDPAQLSLFNEYFPPSQNPGLFVFKLFYYYNRSLPQG